MKRRHGANESKGSEVDRWPAVHEALEDLLAECSAIVAQGFEVFTAPRSLTYRAAEAVVIHFSDLIKNRIPDSHARTIPADLHLPSVETTRNILSHNYREADKSIIWDVVSVHIPRALRQILDADVSRGANSRGSSGATS